MSATYSLQIHSSTSSFDKQRVALQAEGSEFFVFKRDHVPLNGEFLQNWKALAFTIHNPEDESLTLDVVFEGKQKTNQLMVSFSLLPKSCVTIPIDLVLLNSQQLFPARTEGRLRMMVTGKPIKVSEVQKVKIASRAFYKKRSIEILAVTLSQTTSGKIHSPQILMDEFGQWNQKDWDGKIHTREELNKKLWKLSEEAAHFPFQLYRGQGKYYGYGQPTYSASGWFRIEKEAERWWLITPDGYRFFSIGIDSINPGTETGIQPVKPYLKQLDSKLSLAAKKEHSINFGIQNLIEAFGEQKWRAEWAVIVKMYLHRWGINTIGNWSARDFITKAGMPYVLPLDVAGEYGFPTTNIKLFRDFPDVFAGEYKVQAERYAQNLVPFCQDPLLIGYFMRNEPAWGFVHDLSIAEEMLANPNKTASKKVFIQRMKEKYKDIHSFNQAWNLNFEDFSDIQENPLWNASQLSLLAAEDLQVFSEVLIERYVAVPAQACKSVAPNHLNLGMRYAYIANTAMLSGAEYFDVFSLNSYQLSPVDKIAAVAEKIDKPIMIGEFHFGAIDKGLTATGIRGVSSQKERGKAYRYYLEHAAQHPAFIGGHYFMLNDQSCLGRFDGENYQIGFLDICLQEYQEMTKIVKETNQRLPAIHEGEILPSSKKPEQIPPIFC